MTVARWQEFPRLKNVAQPGTTATQSRLDGAEVGAGDFGDLFVGQALYIAQNEDEALLLRQIRQAALDRHRQLAPQRELVGRLGRVGDLERRTVVLAFGVDIERGGWAALADTQDIVTGIGGDPQQP